MTASVHEPTVVQGLVFASIAMGLPEDLYWRTDARCWPDLSHGHIEFLHGGSASSDTFYNGLSVGVWKTHCDIAALVLRLSGSGRFVVSFGLHRLGQATQWLSEHEVVLGDGDGDGDGGAAHDLAVPRWPLLVGGLLFFRVRARGPALLTGAAYATPDAPRHEVRLGIVVTHFNRIAQVQPAVARIVAALLDRPDLAGQLTLTVVDNSRNLDLPAHPRVRHVANRNLGGTGGFVRGLLTLIDGREHTHALFMDDDASCETESIARTLALLRYRRDPDLAVAGALLREAAPWQLVEKGARFDGQVRALHAGLDMRSPADLLRAETDAGTPDYGAWWFFAFPIAAVKRFPFPFFVRGDDIFFGLANRFPIVTLNGVACLGEDFSLKHGPLTAYLDARYHLVHALIGTRPAFRQLLWVARRLFVKALTSYQYTSARAVTLAVRHVLAGPDFFREHLDMQAVRAEIGRWQPNEKLVPIADRNALRLRGARRRREGPLRRLLRTLTLQGFLLPRFLLLDRTLMQDKGFHGSAGDVFRFRRVLYEHGASGTGYVAEHDKGRFFAELKDFVAAWSTLLRQAAPLRARYRDGAEALASETFWRTTYAAEGHAPSAAPAGAAAGADGTEAIAEAAEATAEAAEATAEAAA